MKRKVRVVLSYVAIAVMLFTQNLNVKAVEPGNEKALLNPYETVHTETMENGGGFHEGDIEYSPIVGSKILKLENVDFSQGLTGIEVIARSRWLGAEIYVYLDDPKSDPIARILVRTGSFSKITGIPQKNVTGVHDIYFEANNPIDITVWKAIPGRVPDPEDRPRIEPYQDNEAESNFGTSGVEAVKDNKRTVLAEFSEGDYFIMKDVDFEKGLKSITIEACADSDGIIEVRKDSPTGEVLGSIAFFDTDDAYKPFEGEMANIEGMQKIVFVGKKGSCKIDKWRADPSNTDRPLPNPGEPISPYGYVEAELDFPRENAEIIEDTWNKAVSINGEGGYFSVQKVKFKYGLSSIVVLAKCKGASVIDIRDGSVDGEILGSIRIDDTDGDYNYFSTKAPNIEGMHDLFFVSRIGSVCVDKWSVMSKMIMVPGIPPVPGEEVDDPVKEEPELPEKPELPEEPEKPELPEKPDLPEDPEIALDSVLKLSYERDIWDGGYQINFKLTNESEKAVSDWAVRIEKKYIDIASSWCVNVAEEGEYYVFTPLSWNSSLEAGQSTEFGLIGNGDASGGLDFHISDKNN